MLRSLVFSALCCTCAGLRVLPHTLLRSPPTASCAAVAQQDDEFVTSREKRALAQQAEREGVQPGGWDNDEYLAFTKANPPPPPDISTALRQAYAYRDMLKEKGLPARPDVQKMIEELEQGADPATLAAAEEHVANIPDWRPSQSKNPRDHRSDPPPPPNLNQLYTARPGVPPKGLVRLIRIFESFSIDYVFLSFQV